jgi:ketosteroid isomerase-like protein
VAGENRAFVEQFYGAIGRDLVDALTGDEVMRMGERFAGSLTDDFECVMVGPLNSISYEGLAGFAEAWRDWVEPYESFHIQLEDIEERGKNLLMMVRQGGVTRHDGVEIENDSAAVWRFRDGKLARAEFYLERDDARAAFEAAS